MCDLRDAAGVRQIVTELRPDVVVHAQAMSNVDQAQEDPPAARAMNVDTTRHLADAAAETSAVLITISTDYVFDGTKGSPYDEADVPRPLSVYGDTKLQSERVTLALASGFVVRVGTLFGPGRATFCERVITQAHAAQPVEAFEDQVTSPTFTDDVAETLAKLVRLMDGPGGAVLPSRVLHVANTGACSRVEFARTIIQFVGGSTACLRPVRMTDQQRPAPRPAYSALTSRYLTAILGGTLRP